MSEPLLSVKDLKIHYPARRKHGMFSEQQYVKAVDGISFDVNHGETFGLVGESGCGKSTTGKAIVRLLKPTEGKILLNGVDVFDKNIRKNTRELLRKIQIIFQDPYSSLDPQFTVGRIIQEPMVANHVGNRQERRERTLQLMRDVGLREENYTKYPHEFSGGQRQRIGIARALALQPWLLVCDEPVSALDVSIQAQILNMMQELQRQYDLTYIFISHNLSVIKHICNRVAVMYLGHIVEIADKRTLFDNPLHPYTNALLSAIPVPDPKYKSIQEPLEGDVPSALNPPEGCPFHTRCKYTGEQCRTLLPSMREVEPGHFVVCHRINEPMGLGTLERKEEG